MRLNNDDYIAPALLVSITFMVTVFIVWRLW